jgi:hypothetical protein
LAFTCGPMPVAQRISVSDSITLIYLVVGEC